ncbi:hypothetical protein JYU34_009779 [Plutella xylostella]|uniref:DUF4758 domain-containing protein n=1 Tax=Plutella xylostella TaxID=51655 RepID=A0ABQ7QLL4_PLUXY|nr:hypothetical protein JYU34_009779 [Plutella xylostella]
MDRRILLLFAVSAHLCSVASSDGGNLLTQTVYGFLDFTTTIGNTVMVFSPASAPAPEPPTTEKVVQENIIETKPPPIVNAKPENIKPSKLSDTKDNTKKPASPVVLSSAVSVVTSPPKKEEKPKPVIKEIKQVISKVEVVASPSKIVENPPKQNAPKSNKPSSQSSKKKEQPIKSVTNIVSSKVEVKEGPPPSATPKLHSVVEIKSSEPADEEPAILITNNNIGEPEYDFLSRQPSEFVEETYKVINLRPSKAHQQKPKHKNRPPTPPPEDDDEHPIGLVTTLGGTIVRDGLTTVHETSVIGTYISGKYAQVLNSNSRVLQPSGHKAKISPTPTHRILKTPAPGISKNRDRHLEPTPSIDDSGFENNKNTRRAVSSGSSYKNRDRSQVNSNAKNDHDSNPGSSKKFKNRVSSQSQRTQSEPSASFSNRRKSNNRNSIQKSSVAPTNSENQSRRGFKPRIQPSAVEQVTPSASTSVYKFKLNRAPGSGRWQYKTSPKPKVTIRKMKDDDETSTTPSINPLLDDPQSNDITLQSRSDNDLELSGSHSGPGSLLENDTDENSIEKSPPVETLRVEISTPADFKDVYYEIATIRSPYTFQFIPSKTLKEFNSRLDEAGSELHLELDFGDSNEDEEGSPRRVFPPDLDLANIGTDFDLSEVDKYRVPDNHLRLKKAHGQNLKSNHVTEAPAASTPALTPEQAQQLALLRLLNPAAAAQIPNVVTTSKPVLTYETVYESHVIPFFDGKNTVSSTISRPVATLTKTEYEIGTSSLPALPQPLNPLFPQQFSLTSTPVVLNTEVTATESQVLKLTFGAKTVYTTLFSTRVVPTVLTSYVTSSVAVQPSAAPGFPGYFPQPFPPFPYVG